MAARILLSAVELDVFTLLGNGPRSRARLAAEAGLHDRGAADFLDALVALGLLERDGDTYRNSPEADLYLDRHKPTYLPLDAASYERWTSLTEALRTGRSVRSVAEKEDRWILAPVVRELVTRLDWGMVERVVEIGGSGELVVQLAQAHPRISGGVLGAAPGFTETVARLFLADRLAAFDGDWHTTPLPPADVYVFGGLPARLGPADREALLAEAHRSLPAGGRLIVRDTLVDDDRRRNTAGLLGSLGLLLETSAGRRPTVGECRGWLLSAGFSEVRTEELGYGQTAVIGHR